MIWLYQRLRKEGRDELIDPDGTSAEIERQMTNCAFCCVPLKRIGPAGFPETTCEGTALSVRVCPQCGWWTVERDDISVSHYKSGSDLYCRGTGYAWGCLKPLDVSDAQIPISELRTYLIARYVDRFHLSPRRFEEIVAGVFSDFGYSVRVTSFSRDDGIDVVALDGTDDALIGIQVKRYKGKIEAEQIRSFAGSLVLGGITKGVFVTTSSFTRGAENTASRFTLRGVPIELDDAARFYDRLRITSRPEYDRVDDPDAPFAPLLKGLANFYHTSGHKAWI